MSRLPVVILYLSPQLHSRWLTQSALEARCDAMCIIFHVLLRRSNQMKYSTKVSSVIQTDEHSLKPNIAPCRVK
jgi:hypothetical protein